MFIAGLLMGIIMCVLLLTGFVCEVMGIEARVILEDADSNYESNCSEKPNNCETCGTPRHLCKYCIEEDRMWTPKDEPREYPCEFCKNSNSQKCFDCKDYGSNYEPKDEHSGEATEMVDVIACPIHEDEGWFYEDEPRERSE